MIPIARPAIAHLRQWQQDLIRRARKAISSMPLPPNPWMQLREAPWVLPQDKVAVGKHNKRYQGTAYELRLELRPEPFIGAPAAPVWLLNLNPGFDEDDLDVGPQIIARQEQGI